MVQYIVEPIFMGYKCLQCLWVTNGLQMFFVTIVLCHCIITAFSTMMPTFVKLEAKIYQFI